MGKRRLNNNYIPKRYSPSNFPSAEKEETTFSMRFGKCCKKYPRLCYHYSPIPLRYTYLTEDGKEFTINFALFPPVERGKEYLSEEEKKEVKRNLLQILQFWKQRGKEVPQKIEKMISILLS